MKRVRHFIFLGGIWIFILLLAGCAAKTATPREYLPDRNFQHTVILLYHKTPFKTELITGIAKGLKAKGIRTITDDLKRAEEYSPVEADLVVLVVSVWAGQATGDAVDYLDSHAGASNIMVVSTSGRGTLTGLEHHREYRSIEAVTGASSIESAGAFAEKIIDAIWLRVNKSGITEP